MELIDFLVEHDLTLSSIAVDYVRILDKNRKRESIENDIQPLLRKMRHEISELKDWIESRFLGFSDMELMFYSHWENAAFAKVWPVKDICEMHFSINGIIIDWQNLYSIDGGYAILACLNNVAHRIVGHTMTSAAVDKANRIKQGLDKPE